MRPDLKTDQKSLLLIQLLKPSPPSQKPTQPPCPAAQFLEDALSKPKTCNNALDLVNINNHGSTNCGKALSFYWGNKLHTAYLPLDLWRWYTWGELIQMSSRITNILCNKVGYHGYEDHRNQYRNICAKTEPKALLNNRGAMGNKHFLRVILRLIKPK